MRHGSLLQLPSRSPRADPAPVARGMPLFVGPQTGTEVARTCTRARRAPAAKPSSIARSTISSATRPARRFGVVERDLVLDEAAGRGAVEQPARHDRLPSGSLRSPCRRAPAGASRRRRSPSSASTGSCPSCDPCTRDAAPLALLHVSIRSTDPPQPEPSVDRAPGRARSRGSRPRRPDRPKLNSSTSASSARAVLRQPPHPYAEIAAERGDLVTPDAVDRGRELVHDTPRQPRSACDRAG